MQPGARPAGFLSRSGPDTEELSIKDSRIDLNLDSQPEDMLSMLSSQSHADQAGGPGGEAQGRPQQGGHSLSRPGLESLLPLGSLVSSEHIASTFSKASGLASIKRAL